MNFISLKISDLKAYYKSDILSGFLVFLIALPLSLGIAMASGFPAMSGIIAAIVGGLVVSFFTGSYLTIAGPAAGLIVVILSGAEKLGNGDIVAGYRLTLAAIFFAGLIQFLFGVFKSGKLATFFPSAAVHGMMASIGIIIICKQIFTMFGVKAEHKEIIPLIMEIPSIFTRLNPEITFIGLFSLGILIVLPKIPIKFFKKIPGPMVVVLFGIAFDHIFGLSDKHTYQIWDNIFEVGPTNLVQLPAQMADGIVFPDFSAIGTLTFWVLTFTIALVASLESILSMTAIRSIDPMKRKINFDKDISALGLGCAVSGLLGGLPIIAEIVRSSSNVNNGGKTPWANLFHGFFLLFFILFFPSLLQQIPLASLAAILVFVGWRLANPKEFAHMYHIGFEQLLIFIVTIFMTLKTDLLIGVFSGIALKILIAMIRGLTVQEFFIAAIKIQKEGDTALIIIQNGATFWNLFKLKQIVESVPEVKDLKIDITRVKLVDHTTLDYFQTLEESFADQNKTFVVIGLNDMKPFSKHKLSGRYR
jgi:MFS superfamily sulfate permease-like transporter